MYRFVRLVSLLLVLGIVVPSFGQDGGTTPGTAPKSADSGASKAAEAGTAKAVDNSDSTGGGGKSFSAVAAESESGGDFVCRRQWRVDDYSGRDHYFAGG